MTGQACAASGHGDVVCHSKSKQANYTLRAAIKAHRGVQWGRMQTSLLYDALVPMC